MLDTLYELGPGNVWTGETRTIEPDEDAPTSWVRAEDAPAPPEGDFAQFTGGGWSYVHGLVYALGPGNVWTGETRPIAPHEGCPPGWCWPEAAPEPEDGQDAVFSGGGWAYALGAKGAAQLEADRAGLLEALDAQFAAQVQKPFAWDFGKIKAKDDAGAYLGAAGAQTLQMRVDPSIGLDDPKNWLAAQQGATMALIAGAPATVIPIKTAGNAWVQTSALQLSQALVTGDGTQLSMLQRGVAALARNGALKAAIRAAASAEDLAAIDITSGWPG